MAIRSVTRLGELWKFLVTKSLSKVAQMLGILGYFQNIAFKVKNDAVTFMGNFKKNWATCLFHYLVTLAIRVFHFRLHLVILPLSGGIVPIIAFCSKSLGCCLSSLASQLVRAPYKICFQNFIISKNWEDFVSKNIYFLAPSTTSTSTISTTMTFIRHRCIWGQIYYFPSYSIDHVCMNVQFWDLRWLSEDNNIT